jgi:negative regulator of genetic competence, sporulation and motility
MTNDFDMRDILLEATAEVQEIFREVMEELIEPMEMEQARMLWSQLPDEAKELFAKENPDEYRMLMEQIGRS